MQSLHCNHFIAFNIAFITLYLLHLIYYVAFITLYLFHFIYYVAFITLYLFHCIYYITFIKLHLIHCIYYIAFITQCSLQCYLLCMNFNVLYKALKLVCHRQTLSRIDLLSKLKIIITYNKIIMIIDFWPHFFWLKKFLHS